MHDQIDAFGGAAHKDAFPDVAGVHESLDLLARALISVRGFHAEIMHSAMDIGMFVFKVLHPALDHHLGDLRRRGIVEIDERVAVHGLAEHRKILADTRDVPNLDGLGLDRNQLL